MTGQPHLCLRVRGPQSKGPKGKGVRITDAYVPSGAMSFTVADVSGFKAGEDVVVRKPVTAEWVRFMGMDAMTRDGKPQTWVRGGEIETRRQVRAVEGNRITLAVPLTDSLD